ncbi:MAG: hypothetical protein QE271_07370 [Bacteriovoracaceae bacterium]|nr:hypothetical protein [Bacteriovoracaceae bacterium]
MNLYTKTKQSSASFSSGDWHHLDECSSTQIILKQWWEGHQNNQPADNCVFALSTFKQTNGIGRSDHMWSHYRGAMAISVILPLLDVATLSPLHMGVMLKNFMIEHWKLPSDKANKIGLKWPNDIMMRDEDGKRIEKMGGILCHAIDQKVIIGVGLNIYFDEHFSDYASLLKPQGSKNEQIQLKDYELFLKFMEKSWLQNSFSVEEWNRECVHIKHPVSLDLGQDKRIEGIFEGIGPWGEAIIDGKKYSSGSLFLHN